MGRVAPGSVSPGSSVAKPAARRSSGSPSRSSAAVAGTDTGRPNP